jgi:hypothetical protein
VAEPLNQEQQREIADRLQGKWLLAMERMLDNGTITSTDMATLARWLMANGWSLDPSKMPVKLSSLIEKIGPEAFEELPVRLVR